MALTNPQASDHIAAEAGTFEPQRQNNWSLEITLDEADKDVIIASLVSSALPPESNDEVEIQYQNEKRYVAGQATFETIPLTLVDYVDVETRNAILRWRLQVYNPETGAIGLAKDYKKRGSIIMTAPDGSTERVCRLVGLWPSAVPNPGTLDMSGSDKVMIEVTLRYDKAVWKTL
jgi:hypothetical protein